MLNRWKHMMMPSAGSRALFPVAQAGGRMVSAAAIPGPDTSGLACLVIIGRHYGVDLSVPQLVSDNFLSANVISGGELIRCARSAGLKAKAVKLDWDGLAQLKRALPAIVRLQGDIWMVLSRVTLDGERAVGVVLRDPNGDVALALDRVRFEDAWTGDLLLVKPNYDVADETQPFGIGLVTALIVRERWIVRDLVVCAVILGFLALMPIVFWRLLSNKVIYFKAENTFYVVCVAFVAAVAFEALFNYIRQMLVVYVTTRVDLKLGSYLFEKLLNLPMDFFEKIPVGRLTHDVNQLWKIRKFLTGQLFGTVLDSSTLVIIFLPVMFFFSPLMTFIVLILCGLIVGWLVIMLPVHRRRSSAVEAAEAERSALLIQTLHGVRTVKSLALDSRQKHLWDILSARVAKLRSAEGMTANLIQAVARPIERLAVTGPFAVGVYMTLTTNDPVYVGSLFAFLMLSQRVSSPLLQAAKLINQYDEARIAVAVVSDVLNRPPEEGRTGTGVRTPLTGNIQFSKVTFTYKGAAEPALENVSFEVPAGTTLGVVGRSGSGKTTITRLLQRLHSEYAGLIKVDGIDVRQYDIHHLRRSTGVVLQENFLFSATIRQNIAAGKPDATFDEVVRAARLAGAEEFIDKLPRGFETFIYEGSPNLSGGQRQRLAIARALVLDPRILILDEATSALDAESEAIVNDNISRIASGRTLIIVSHRLTSLIWADRILVLERGEVNAIGTHGELLERCDIYKHLWEEQTRHMAAGSQGSGGLRRVN
jgi:ATP-binding cassette subfamily B protein